MSPHFLQYFCSRPIIKVTCLYPKAKVYVTGRMYTSSKHGNGGVCLLANVCEAIMVVILSSASTNDVRYLATTTVSRDTKTAIANVLRRLVSTNMATTTVVRITVYTIQSHTIQFTLADCNHKLNVIYAIIAVVPNVSAV